MSGVIDPHVHLDMDFMSTYSSDNYETVTRAALQIGKTIIINFIYGNKTVYHKLHWKNGVVEMIIIMQEYTALKDGISHNRKEIKSCYDLILTAKIIYFSLLEIL